MPQRRKDFVPSDLAGRQEEARKEFDGFLKSYKEFLEKWGSYKRSKAARMKPRERPKHTIFRATFHRSE